MSLRRTRVALLLALGLTAITLTAAHALATGDASWTRTRNAPLSIGVGAVDGLVSQAIEQDRRDVDTTRNPSHRVGLFAVVAGVISLAWSTRRRAGLVELASATARPADSPNRGRAPPVLLASIV